MKYRWIFVFALVIAAGAYWTQRGEALTVAERTSGYIVLQTERNGEAWYVYPKTLTRFYLGGGEAAVDLMRKLGLGITNADLAKIPIGGSSDVGDTKLRNRLKGYILLQVEKDGEAWYVYPKDQKRYFLGRADVAYPLMRKLGLGITNNDIAQIPVDSNVKVTTRSVPTVRGTYTVNYLGLDLNTSNFKIMTDTGMNANCANNCSLYSLGTYVARRGGVAGIHGTYFCPPDYGACAGQVGFYYYPVYNSFTKRFINADRIKFTSEPIVGIDTSNKLYMFKQTKTFTSEQDFYNEFKVVSAAAGGSGVLQAAISNGPALIIDKKNVVGQYYLDSKQRTVKSYRGALAWKDQSVYLMVVSGATVIDSAAVMEAMGMDNALNLDGGGSTALYNSGRYILGPGRSLPNAIVILAQ
jgi:hypothetical protein